MSTEKIQYGPTAHSHIKEEDFINLIIIQYISVNIMLFSCKQIEGLGTHLFVCYYQSNHS